MKLLLAACAVAALAPLSACNRSAEAGAAAPQEIDLPAVPAGKWHWRQQIDGRDGGFPGEKCESERTLWDVMEVGVAGLKSCRRSIVKQGAGYAAQYQCTSGKSAITINATVSGDFKSHFRMESVQKFDPALSGTTRQTISIQAERRGDC